MDQSYAIDESNLLYEMGRNQVGGESSSFNKWLYEELTFLESYGQKLIGCNCYNGKLILVFNDFTIREVSLQTMAELPA